MGSYLLSALLLMLPLVVSGVFHMWVVRKNWLASLAQPIHRGAFGANKSWRGLIVMALATIPGVYLMTWIATSIGADIGRPLSAISTIALGIALGLGYTLAELPNSFVKRRLGIAPGARAARHRFWFTLVDQADSAVGCAVVYALAIDVPFTVLLLFVLAGPVVHLIANLALFSAGLRKEAF